MKKFVIIIAVAGLLLGGASWAFLAFNNGGNHHDGKLVMEAGVHQVGRILASEIDESSGLVESRLRPGVYWTHNDHGNKPALYAIDRSGASINRIGIDAPIKDWEDIAFDEEGRLYIGDIGDNGRDRSSLRVYRMDEPDPRANPPRKGLRPERRWELQCPGENQNFESLVIWKGFAYLISKSSKHPAGLYRFALDSGEKVKLDHIGKMNIHEQATGADITPDGRLLAVLTYAGVHVYRIDGDVEAARKAQGVFIPIKGRQIEGCCFTTGGILISAESRELFFCPESEYASLLAEPARAP